MRASEMIKVPNRRKPLKKMTNGQMKGQMKN